MTLSATTDHYEITSDAKSTTIRLQPVIGNAAWGDIEQVSTELLESVNQKKASAWLVDLSQLEFMGSALVALLVRIWKAVQAGGGKVVVVCGEGMPREVIRLAGLDRVWMLSETVEDGYKTLGVRPPVPAEGAGAQPASAPAADGFPILGVLSFVAAFAAGVALALVLGRAEIEQNLAQLGMFGGAGIAVALGLLSFHKETSWGRGLGCVGLLAGIFIGVVGYRQRPENPDRALDRQSTESQPDNPQAGQETEAESPPDETAADPEQPDESTTAVPTDDTDPDDVEATTGTETGSAGDDPALEETSPSDESPGNQSGNDPTEPE